MQKFLSATLPAALALALFLALPSVASAQSTCGPTETVMAGDTLQAIALRCNTTVPAILTLNPAITNPDLIRVGQVINITNPAQPSDGQDQAATPATDPAIDPTADPEGDAAAGSVEIYTVQPGDWLSLIATRFNTTIAALVAANPVITNPDQIVPGQELVVPVVGTVTVTGTITDTAAVTNTVDELISDPTVTITPTNGPPGTLVQVVGTGFSSTVPVDIGIGQVASEYTIVQEGIQTNVTGTVTTTIAIPEGAESGQALVVAIAPVGSGFEAISNVFNVSESGGDEPSDPAAIGFDQTQIYLVAVGDAGQSGQQFGCGDSLVPVTVEIEPTLGILTAALEQLVNLDEQFYGESGLYNALYQSDLTLEDVQIEEGEAQISLSGEIMQGGACDTPRIQAQLEETALQFATVDQVTILVNGLPLDEVIQ